MEERMRTLTATVFEILFAAALLCGVWNKDKLIRLEDRIGDALAYMVAQIIIRARRYGR